MKQPRLNLDEHRCVAAELKRRRDQFGSLFMAYAERYGKTKTVTRRAAKVQKAIDQLRCELENILAKDFPEQFDTKIYYPGDERGNR